VTSSLSESTFPQKNGSPEGVRNTVSGQPPVRRVSKAWAVW
jgi:hypothetical protein